MTKDIVLAVITFLPGGVLGGLIQAVYNYKKEILSSIWAKRFEEYKTVWEITGVLPKYPEDNNVTYRDLYYTCIKLKNWYFKNGGIILSTKSRKAYEQLQKTLFATSKNQQAEKIRQADYKKLREIFSLFRGELTNDLTSRNKSIL
jgi:hypothetical protein